MSSDAQTQIAKSYSAWYTSCASEYDDRGSLLSDVVSLEDVSDGKQDEPLTENGTIIYSALQKVFPVDENFHDEAERKYYLTLWSRTFEKHPECDAYVRRLQHLKKPTAQFFSDWSYADVEETRINEDGEEEIVHYEPLLTPLARLHYLISRR